MSVINVAPIESMARRALVKNLKNHIGNSLMAMLGPYSAAVVHCASLNLLRWECPGSIWIDLRDVRWALSAYFNPGHITALRWLV
jgi:hypothetical protein